MYGFALILLGEGEVIDIERFSLYDHCMES